MNEFERTADFVNLKARNQVDALQKATDLIRDLYAPCTIGASSAHQTGRKWFDVKVQFYVDRIFAS
jgi:hypothetical protein